MVMKQVKKIKKNVSCHLNKKGTSNLSGKYKYLIWLKNGTLQCSKGVQWL